jgi:hypothetical protein
MNSGIWSDPLRPAPASVTLEWHSLPNVTLE